MNEGILIRIPVSVKNEFVAPPANPVWSVRNPLLLAIGLIQLGIPEGAVFPRAWKVTLNES